SPRLVNYGTRNHQRHVASGFFQCIGDSEQRSLSVERVENGLDDEKIDTAFEQGSRFIEISLAKLIERDRAKSRIIYVRRNGTRNRKRSHRSATKPPLAGFIRNAIGGLPRDP